MESKEPGNFGPPPEKVTTYIAPPESYGGFFAGILSGRKSSSTESKVSASITIDQPSKEENGAWLLEYLKGRDSFRATNLQLAQESQVNGQPALAIAYAKMAGEVEELSPEWIVPSGMLPFLAIHYKLEGANRTGSGDFKQWFKAINEADRRAFSVPQQFTDSIDQIKQECQIVIDADPERHWLEALHNFNERSEYHPAGIAAFELGNLYKDSKKSDEAADAYFAANQFFDKGLKSLYDQDKSAQNTAEATELRARYDMSLENIVIVLDGKRLTPEHKQMLRSVLTTFIKLGNFKYTTLSLGYRTLAQNSSWGEKHKYKKNVKILNFQEEKRKYVVEALKHYGAVSYPNIYPLEDLRT